MNRNNFFTFLLGFIPGAGQMYLGSMKKGICIMTGFGIVWTICNLLPIYLINFILPVIWFYAFFDTLILGRLNEDERRLDEEEFLHKLKSFLNQDWHAFFTKHRIVLGTVVILLGVYTLFDRLVLPILYRFGDYLGWFHSFFYNIPSLILGILLLIGGFYLIMHFKSNEE